GTGNLFLEHLSAAGAAQLGILRTQVLAVGRNPRISKHRHPATLSCIGLLSIRYARLNRAKMRSSFSCETCEFCMKLVPAVAQSPQDRPTATAVAAADADAVALTDATDRTPRMVPIGAGARM